MACTVFRVDPSNAETRIFQDDEVSTFATDALAPCVTITTFTTLLTMQDNRIPFSMYCNYPHLLIVVKGLKVKYISISSKMFRSSRVNLVWILCRHNELIFHWPHWKFVESIDFSAHDDSVTCLEFVVILWPDLILVMAPHIVALIINKASETKLESQLNRVHSEEIITQFSYMVNFIQNTHNRQVIDCPW